MLGFQVAPGAGGREGLEAASAWYREVKWQALAAKQIALRDPPRLDLVVGLGHLERRQHRSRQGRGRLRLSLDALALAL